MGSAWLRARHFAPSSGEHQGSQLLWVYTLSHDLLDRSYDTWYGAIDLLFCIVGTYFKRDDAASS